VSLKWGRNRPRQGYDESKTTKFQCSPRRGFFTASPAVFKAVSIVVASIELLPPMPQRFLKPGIRQSRRWNRISWLAQSLYVRLVTLVDDFARYEADPELLRSELFPYGDPDGNPIQLTAIDSACEQLSEKDMVHFYIHDGVKYCQLKRWTERTRAEKSKYPAPLTTVAVKCCQPLTNAASPSPSPPSTSSPPASPSPVPPAADFQRPETLSHLPTEAAALKWLADWQASGADYSEAETKSAFLALTASGWMWGRNPVTDHRAALERQIQTDRTKTNHGNNSKNNQRPDRSIGTLNEGTASQYRGIKSRG